MGTVVEEQAGTSSFFNPSSCYCSFTNCPSSSSFSKSCPCSSILNCSSFVFVFLFLISPNSELNGIFTHRIQAKIEGAATLDIKQHFEELWRKDSPQHIDAIFHLDGFVFAMISVIRSCLTLETYQGSFNNINSET